MFALTRRGWGLLLGAAAVGGAWLLLGLRDLWYLAAFLLALVVIGAISAALAPVLARPRVSVGVTDPAPIAGERVVATAAVRHRLGLDLAARATWRFGGAPAVVDEVVLGRRGAALRCGFDCERRGPATVRLAALDFVDPLGVARGRIRVDAAAELLVLPRVLDSLASRLDGADAGEGGALTARRPALSALGEPGGAVREYRSGDAMRQVHWKQSARQGELLVNLPESSSPEARTVLLDTDPDSYDDADGFETAVSAAAALALHWLHRGRDVRLVVDERPPTLLSGETEALRALASVGLGRGAEAPGEARAHREPLNAAVTGAPSPRLAERLRTAGARAGLLVSVGPAPSGAVPDGWRHMRVDRDG